MKLGFNTFDTHALANDAQGQFVPLVETALTWGRAIADFRPAAAGEGEAAGEAAAAPSGGGFGMMPV